MEDSIYMNFPLIASIFAIVFTQLIKYPIAKFFKKGTTNIDIVTSTGGMPSSHSAATSALITALILQYGIRSPYVSIAMIFGVIIMFDSMGVRRQSGEQGLVLKEIIKEHNKNGQTIGDFSKEKIDDMVIDNYLGHKPTEVIVGILTGIVLAIILYQILGVTLPATL